LQIRPATGKQGPAALTNMKQDHFDQLDPADIVKRRGGASEILKSAAIFIKPKFTYARQLSVNPS
jgi:hypothetical protein